MLAERVARFDTLVPTAKSFVDTAVDGHQRDIFMVIGNGVNEDATSRPAIYWLDHNNVEQEVILEKHDVISVPPGIFRGFRNDSNEKALLFAINGNTDPGRVEWPQELLDRAAAKGYTLDGNGNLLENGASQ
jgi:hypothetical protein